MASVRMTGILREEIMDNAMKAFDKANPEIKYRPKHVNEIIDNFTSLPIQQFWKQTYAKAYTVLNELYSGRKDNWDDGDNIVVGEITEFKCLLEKPVSEGNDKWISFTVSECPKFVGYHPSKNLGENSYYNRLKIYLTKEEENILPGNLKWEDFGLSIKKDNVFDLSSKQMRETILLELNEYTTRKREVTKIYCKSCYFN